MWPSTGQNSGYKTNHNKASLSGDRSPFTSTLLSLCFPYELWHRHKFDKTSSRSTPWSLWATEEMLHRTVAASLWVDLLHIYKIKAFDGKMKTQEKKWIFLFPCSTKRHTIKGVQVVLFMLFSFYFQNPCSSRQDKFSSAQSWVLPLFFLNKWLKYNIKYSLLFTWMICSLGYFIGLPCWKDKLTGRLRALLLCSNTLSSILYSSKLWTASFLIYSMRVWICQRPRAWSLSYIRNTVVRCWWR